jgi:acyl-coenzyme A synthetase/AMP-(fatty) acid ligase
MAHFKAPRHVVFVDNLPKTATGKLQRFKVRALLAGADAVGNEDLTSSGAST